MSRIGVFICHCGLNIAGTIDVERAAEMLRAYPGVVQATTYRYMCSDPGQSLIRDEIARRQLDGVVVAACSPAMHEVTFRRAVAAAGLNPYRCEIANIREQCAWVHQAQRDEATLKAVGIIASLIEKVKGDQELEPLSLPLVKQALVIGGGIAGLQAALDIAAGGYPVLLVEREATLGGKMARLSGSYLNFDDTNDMLASVLAAVAANPLITVHTSSEVKEVSGYVGNFQVQLMEAMERDDSLVAKAGTEMTESSRSINCGAIVVATGYELYPQEQLGEYGAGRLADVVDGLQFEEMLRRPGPLRRPSDGKTARAVVFIQCAGSRDPEHGVPYCSKICCMVTAKQALMVRRRVSDGQAYVFYIDIRAPGKGSDEFVQQAMAGGVLYLRGKVSRLFADEGKVTVWGADTLSGRSLEIDADLVVLATAMTPSAGAADLARRLHIAADGVGFYSEAHPKLRPVESLTAGVYLAGAGQAPKDIPEAVAQAGGAAAKVLSLFSRQNMVQEPTVAYVVGELCAACGQCLPACPYGARALHAWKRLATVNQALCQGCGACLVACPNKATQLHNSAAPQLLAMSEAIF